MVVQGAKLQHVTLLILLAAIAASMSCSRSNVSAAAAPVSPPVVPTVQQAPQTLQPVQQPVAAKDLHGLQLAETWSAEMKSAKLQFADVYLVQTSATLGSEVDAAQGRLDFLTYKMCISYPPSEQANQKKCDKLIDRVEAESNKLPKW